METQKKVKEREPREETGCSFLCLFLQAKKAYKLLFLILPYRFSHRHNYINPQIFIFYFLGVNLCIFHMYIYYLNKHKIILTFQNIFTLLYKGILGKIMNFKYIKYKNYFIVIFGLILILS